MSESEKNPEAREEKQVRGDLVNADDLQRKLTKSIIAYTLELFVGKVLIVIGIVSIFLEKRFEPGYFLLGFGLWALTGFVLVLLFKRKIKIDKDIEAGNNVYRVGSVMYYFEKEED